MNIFVSRDFRMVIAFVNVVFVVVLLILHSSLFVSAGFLFSLIQKLLLLFFWWRKTNIQKVFCCFIQQNNEFYRNDVRFCSVCFVLYYAFWSYIFLVVLVLVFGKILSLCVSLDIWTKYVNKNERIWSIIFLK